MDEDVELTKRDLFDQISSKFHEIQRVLTACGIRSIRMPEYSEKMRVAQLRKVNAALAEFMTSDAVDIFKQAESLRPPGVLALWIQDDLTRDARESRIYAKALRLVKTVWRETPLVSRFFKIRKVTQDATSG